MTVPPSRTSRTLPEMALDNVTFAAALHRARHAAGLSISALARTAETSRAAVYGYEAGDREPSISTALRLLRACGYTLHVARH